MRKHGAATCEYNFMSLTSPSNPVQPNPVALFISDLHLQQDHTQTTAAFLEFLQQHAIHASVLYILGDLFEYWAGDDDIDTPYHQQIVEALKSLSKAGVQIFWIEGNRDFLVSDAFLTATGATALADPCIVSVAGKSIILTHGDAYCTDDLSYMEFRQKVRDPAWKRQFLAMPLQERKKIIAALRTGSRAEQREKDYAVLDVNQDAIKALFSQLDASIMIHGHTHRPARHVSHAPSALVRYVLPDWDYDDQPTRGGHIAIFPDGSISQYLEDGSVLAD